MDLNEYRKTCAEVLTGLPLELCAGGDIFDAGDWSEADRLTLLRLHTLYGMVAIHETAGDDEPMLYFDYLWALPVREEPKVDVLNNMRAVCND
jgi:hypothetical protein